MEDSFLKVPKVGVGVLVVRDDQVLLGKRCGRHMNGLYAAPGGHLEYGESFVECASREVKEETGLDLDSLAFLMIGNYELDSRHYIDVDMVAVASTGGARVMEPDKCEHWRWYCFDDLPAPLFIVTERMIEAYLHGFNADSLSIERILKQQGL